MKKKFFKPREITHNLDYNLKLSFICPLLDHLSYMITEQLRHRNKKEKKKKAYENRLQKVESKNHCSDSEGRNRVRSKWHSSLIRSYI